MKNTYLISLLCIVCMACNASAQDTTKRSYLNFGVGASNWGIPIYGGIEFPVGKGARAKDQSIAIGASYQSKKESYTYYGETVSWKHTIIGVSLSYNYYFDRVLGLPDEFDLYGGLGIGYFLWKTTLTYSYAGFHEPYTGSGNGGIGISYIAGARYYLNPKLAINAHFGGSTVLSSARLGLSLRF